MLWKLRTMLSAQNFAELKERMCWRYAKSCVKIWQLWQSKKTIKLSLITQSCKLYSFVSPNIPEIIQPLSGVVCTFFGTLILYLVELCVLQPHSRLHRCQTSLPYPRLSDLFSFRVRNSMTITFTEFVQVLENLESPGMLLWHFPGLESPGKRLLVLERSGNLLNWSKKIWNVWQTEKRINIGIAGVKGCEF